MAYNTMAQSVLNKSRADKFLLVFDIPPILKEFDKKFKQSNTTIVSDSVQFSIFGTAVPEITVPADNEYKNYWVIYQWLNLLHDQYDGKYNAREVNSNDPDENFKDYQTNLTIFGKDEFNNSRIKFTYTKAFPTTIDTIDYNYQNPDEISSGFTFVYSQLHTEVMDF